MDVGQDKQRLPPVKSGRVDGKNSVHRSGGFLHKQLKRELFLVLSEYRGKAAHKERKVGSGTQDRVCGEGPVRQ